MKRIKLLLVSVALIIFGFQQAPFSTLLTYRPENLKRTTSELAFTQNIDSRAKYIQLRLFVINRGKMDQFLDAWLKGVYPLRIKSGFKIEGAWVVSERNEFIWILSYDGPENFESKDSAYYASAGRTAINPDPAQYIARSEKYFIKQVIPPE